MNTEIVVVVKVRGSSARRLAMSLASTASLLRRSYRFLSGHWTTRSPGDGAPTSHFHGRRPIWCMSLPRGRSSLLAAPAATRENKVLTQHVKQPPTTRTQLLLPVAAQNRRFRRRRPPACAVLAVSEFSMPTLSKKDPAPALFVSVPVCGSRGPPCFRAPAALSERPLRNTSVVRYRLQLLPRLGVTWLRWRAAAARRRRKPKKGSEVAGLVP